MARCKCGKVGTTRQVFDPSGAFVAAGSLCSDCMAKAQARFEELQGVFNGLLEIGLSKSEANAQMKRLVQQESATGRSLS